jgi:hypothetical protein
LACWAWRASPAMPPLGKRMDALAVFFALAVVAGRRLS